MKNKILLSLLILIVIVAGVYGYKKMMEYQAKRDACYAGAIHSLGTTDQSLLQGNKAYSDCIKKIK